MSARYTQSKSEAAKHTEILKAMLKRPENKLCADCKRNDPRWASTNLGCFMCIRCSGIHRGMGVHITRIKSVDLDTWSPEQIENVQRWGNARANAYWEAHLKPGHMPPEHKMESFIRSKYETKRWAMEGPMPEPETLDEQGVTAAAPAPTPAPSTSRTTSAAPPTAAPARKAPNAIDLLAGPPSTSSHSIKSSVAPPGHTPSASPAPAAPAAPKPSGGGGGLFDLDFNAPAPASAPAPKKDAKADILSLFAASPPPQFHPPAQQQQQQFQQQQQPANDFGMGGLSLGGGASDPWGAPVQQQQYRAPVQQAQPPVAQSGWGAFDSFSSPAPAASRQQPDLFASSSDVWGSSTSASNNAAGSSDPFGEFSSGGSGSGAKKQDAFSDIWA
ncbi:hypothetical protein MNV49_005226 [Pseudohyphozyma bogoriensis]|nr:hypothetical protein MNV49_005226 [Pseudohyphozyma bogoriensis]